jgi:hypothetical protein
MKTIICVRRTVDWQKANLEDTPKAFHRFINSWNKKFNISFFEFRHKLKMIAHSNWASVKGCDLIINNVEVANKVLKAIKEDFILCTTDDDDWYSPNLFEELKPYIKESSIRWYHSIFYDGISGRPHNRPGVGFNTNNFAITNIGYRKNLAQKSHRELGALLSKKAKIIKAHLSTTNKTIASIGIFRDHGLPTSRRIKKIIKNIESLKIPEEYSWCTPYVNSIKSLYQKL